MVARAFKNGLILIMFFVMCSCGNSKHAIGNRNERPSSTRAYYEESSGLSKKEAVIIHARGSMEGIPLEYKFVETKEGKRGLDWHLVQQSLVHDNDKSYDILRIRLTKNNEEKTYYFDITDFFGKF